MANHQATQASLYKFMEQHARGPVFWDKDDEMSYQAGGAAGQATIELVPEIAALDGIQRIYEEIPGRPGSSVNQPSPTLTAAQITNADQWHAMGFAGSGVGVGVMDFDFRDFRTRVPAPVLENVRYFCYDANGTVFAGDLRTPTHTAFSACETSDSPLQANPHSTDVAAALVEIAPDANSTFRTLVVPSA